MVVEIGWRCGVNNINSALTTAMTSIAVKVNDIEYKKCDNSYHQPYYEGDTWVYKVVNSPY